MMNEKSRFLKASVKEFTTNSGKRGFNIEINKADFDTFPTNENGFVRLTMWDRKGVGKYGDTAFLVDNTFIPKNQEKNDNPF